MLTQNIQRKDAKGQRRKQRTGNGIRPEIRDLSNPEIGSVLQHLSFASLHLCVFALILFSLSCGSKPTDMRALAPAEALVYLETNDLAAALQPIIDSKPFSEVAKSKPDLSALKGVQVAVAVTGFETTEEKLTDEHSVGRVQPRFVAIIDTHGWNYQAVKFAETGLDRLVQEMLGGGAKLGRSQKSQETGGTYLTWGGSSEGLAHALILDGLIYFSNDATAIDKCLAVQRGEADSIVKVGKVLPFDPKTLASGYVSTDGIAQIANLLGVKIGQEAGDDPEVQSAIAGVLPQLLRDSITEISWTATSVTRNREIAFRDSFVVITNLEVAHVLNETLVPSDSDSPGIEFLPLDTPKATYYNLRDPQIAWRSILLSTKKQTDPLWSKIVGEFSGALFEPYGVRDPEMFLSGAGSNILTANLDPDGDKPLVILEVKDPEKIKKALITEMQPDKQATNDIGVEMWKSSDGDLAAAFIEKYVIVGEAESVLTCVKQKLNKTDVKGSVYMGLNGEPKRPATTIGFDATIAAQIADMLSEKRSDEARTESTYLTETRFTKTGIERRTISDFGLIGSIIAQLASD